MDSSKLFTVVFSTLAIFLASGGRDLDVVWLRMTMQETVREPLLSVDEVARALGISRRTFDHLVARGEGPPFLYVGRQRRWPCGALERWITNRMHANPAAARKAAGKNGVSTPGGPQMTG